LLRRLRSITTRCSFGNDHKRLSQRALGLDGPLAIDALALDFHFSIAKISGNLTYYPHSAPATDEDGYYD